MSDEMTKDMRVYELGYHLVPSIAPENVATEIAVFKDMITKMGGSIIAEEVAKEFSLAYEIRKTIANKKERFSTSYFGWVKFELDSESVLELKKSLDLNTKVIRFLIIKTVKENTLISKRVPREYTKKRYTPKVDEAGVEVNAEEVDKKLDELLAKE